MTITVNSGSANSNVMVALLEEPTASGSDFVTNFADLLARGWLPIASNRDNTQYFAVFRTVKNRSTT